MQDKVAFHSIRDGGFQTHLMLEMHDTNPKEAFASVPGFPPVKVASKD